MATTIDSGEYVCYAFGLYSYAVSEPASVTVIGMGLTSCVTSVAVISPQVVELGTDLNLTCNTTCASNTTQVMWFSPTDGPLNETRSSHTFDEYASTLMSRYAFVDINYSDDVLYGCTVSKYSSISVEVYTHIVIAPTISPPELASSIEDNAFSFTCNVQSFLNSTVKWYKYDLEGEIQEVSSTSGYELEFENVALKMQESISAQLLLSS